MDADCISFTATEVVVAVEVDKSTGIIHTYTKQDHIPFGREEGGLWSLPVVVIGAFWLAGAVGGNTKLPGVLGDGNATTG